MRIVQIGPGFGNRTHENKEFRHGHGFPCGEGRIRSSLKSKALANIWPEFYRVAHRQE
jgi:hypothetical protein